MITVSLCMIVKNEEAVLGRCLQSVQGVADEIIIVDTGSSDQTMEIAASFGAKVYEEAWRDDFAHARNAAFSHATQEYILWLDADDVLDAENRDAFLLLKETLDPAVDVVMMRYHVAFDASGQPTYTFFRERLLKRAMHFCWQGRVHEAIVPRGNVIRSQIAVRHEKIGPGSPGRNIHIYETMIAQGETLEPRHRYYYARELYAHERYEEAVILLQACIEDPQTWIENRIGACRDSAMCLLALQKNEEALQALSQSFAFDEPRAEVCCDMGRIFLRKAEYPAAIFWYESALRCNASDAKGGFSLPECRGYVPYIQLCVCYDHLGDYEKAEAYNEMAAQKKPGDKATLENREYFNRRRAKRAEASL